MRVLIVMSLLVVGLGCPRGGARTPDDISIDDLRAEAAANPGDARVQYDLAIAELLWRDGDPARVEAQVARALELRPESPELHLIAGLDFYLHGDPPSAVSSFVSSLEHAENAPAVAEVAASGVEELIHLTPLEPLRARIEGSLGHLQPGARQTLTDVLVEMAYRRGDRASVKSTAEAMGCITEWRVAGPFGPRDLLGFDKSYAAGGRGQMAARYDLGTGRGVRPTRLVETRGCAAHLGEGPINEGGTTYAEGFFEAPGSGAYTLRLETPNSVELKIDGRQVARLDHRHDPLERVTFHQVELESGRHEVEVKVTSRHPNPIVVVSLSRGGTSSAPPSAGDPLSCYLRSSIHLSRGASIAARQSIRECPASTTRHSLEAAIALIDQFRTPDMRRDEARRLFAEIVRKDSRAWYPVLQLARLKAAEGRDQEAISDLRAAVTLWPKLSTIGLSLAELLLNRGWNGQAKQEIERAMAAAPGTCPPIEAALAEAQQRDAIEEVDEHIDDVMSCNARNTSRFALLQRARRWEEARTELERLASLEPTQARGRLLASFLDLAEGRQDHARVDAILQELAQLHPRSETTQLARVDRVLAAGQRDQALEMMEQLVSSEPMAMLRLRRIRTALGGPSELEGYRVDGQEVIRAYEESGRSYDQPQVLVFDYTVQRVLPDGSSLALTHQIYKLQSEEAVDAQGEFAAPDGSYMLRLRTIKADGAPLEPDLIEGKETISLPNLAIGDYVESEYIRVLDPPVGIPGGILGDRFYFASFEIPFDRSELVVLVPDGMAVVVDPRGDAPQTQRSSENGMQVFRWRVDQSAPLVAEPLSVAGREYIPSINWGVAASWGSFLEGLRDVLADRDIVDPDAQSLAERIVANAETDEEKARRIYYWLLEHVENNNDVFGESATMLADRNGNRSRLLHYLLGLVGVESQLILARGFAGDQTQSELADEDTYRNLLVRLGDQILMTTANGIPFGYISPALRSQDALVLAPYAESDELSRIELPPANADEDKRSIEIDALVSEDGSGRAEIVETFTGTSAIEWRNDLEGTPDAVLNQRFEEGYVARLIPGARLVSLEIDGRQDPEAPVVLRYTVAAPSLARRQGSQLILPGLYATMLSPRFAQAATRTTTQIVGPPLHLDITVRVRTEGGAPRASFEPVRIQAGRARFEMSAQTNDGALVISRQLQVPLMRVSPSDYPGFASFCRRVDEAEAREIPIQ